MITKNDNEPLVLLGLKVGDPEDIVRWSEEGYLPTIASLMKRGCWGTIGGRERICEHGSALSLFSGVPLSEHGYYYFRRCKPGTYDLETFEPQDIDTVPFWSRWTDGSRKIAIVDIPETFPIRGLSGVQVANWHEQADPTASLIGSEPSDLLDDIQNNIASPPVIPNFRSDNSLLEEQATLKAFLNIAKQKGELCRFLFAKERYDLYAAIFDATHRASHQFWKYRPEAVSGGDKSNNGKLSHAIRDVYQEVDRQIGKILATLPDNANVFIFSIFGMHDQTPMSGLNEHFFQALGYHVNKTSPVLAPRPIDIARRIIPQSWRIAIGRALSRRMQERLIADSFTKGTDWEKTTAFAIPSLHTNFVRVNLRGREPHGIVEPGSEYENLLNRIEDDLAQLVDPTTGESAIDVVTRTSKMTGSEPPTTLPDMFVEWKPASRFLEKVVHPRATLVQQKPAYCPDSEETLVGFFSAAGPSIRGRGNIGDVSLLNLTPTWLTLMGERLDINMSKRIVERITRITSQSLQ